MELALTLFSHAEVWINYYKGKNRNFPLSEIALETNIEILPADILSNYYRSKKETYT